MSEVNLRQAGGRVTPYDDPDDVMAFQRYASQRTGEGRVGVDEAVAVPCVTLNLAPFGAPT